MGFTKRHPFLWAALAFLFIFLPQWLQAVWGLFRAEPMVPTIASTIGGIHVVEFNPSWLSFGTVPIGLAFLFLIWKETRKHTTPKESEDMSILAGDVRIITMPGIEGLTPSVTFTTEGKRGQNFNLRERPRALRFVTLGGRIVRAGDLPIEIPCGKGKLLIKQFTNSGFMWDEVGTIGDRVKVEFYPLETSSS